MPPQKKKWSEWKWSEHHQQEYRYRQRENSDRREYQYQDAPQRQASTQARTQAPAAAGNYTHTFSNSVQDVTDQLGRTNLGHADPSNQLITAQDSNGPLETPLDRKYKVHNSSYFKQGSVLKVLWTEPRGRGGTVITQQDASKHNEPMYSSIRRFVVIKPNIGHSLCVPILTYSQQGLLKPGVKPEHHCIIYTDTPQALEDEVIKNHSLEMVPINPREKLDYTSRMNYAKVYTVEHNVKVYFIGNICTKDMRTLVKDYNRINTVQSSMPRSPPSSSAAAPPFTSSYDQATTPSYGTSQPYGRAPSYGSTQPYGTTPSYSTRPSYSTGLTYSTGPSYSSTPSYAPARPYPSYPDTGTGNQPHTYDPSLYDRD